MAQSIITNTFIASFGRIVNAGLGVIVIALLTRQLGPGQFGEYTLVLAYGAIIQIIADLGLYLTLTRELGHGVASPRHYLSHVLSLRLGLLTSAFAVSGLAMFIWPSFSHLGLVMAVAACGLIVQSLSQLLMGVYQSHGVVWRATVGDLAGRLVQIAIILSGHIVAINVFGVMVAFSTGVVVTFVVHQLLLPLGPVWKITYAPTEWRRLVRVSWPLGLMLLMNMIYFRIDTLILSFFRSSAEVGQYGLSYRLIESGLFFPAMFGGLILPRLTSALKDSLSHARELLSQALHALILAALLCLLVIEAMPGPIIHILAGSHFEAAIPLLRILALALAVMFIGNLCGFSLVALGKQKYLLYLYGALAVANTLTNLVFIPHFGALAAAWITVATEVAATCIAFYLVYREVPMSLSWASVWRLSASALITLAWIQISSNILPGLVVGISCVAIYIFTAIILKAITKEDVSLLLARPS